MKQAIVGGFVAVLALSAAAAAQQAPAASRPVVLQRVLVKVNGAVFTKTELEDRQIQALQERNQRVLSQLDLESDEKLRAMLIEITPAIIGEAVDELIMIQRGRELGYTLTDQNFQAALERLKKDNNLDDATFAAAIKEQGITMEQLRSQFERQYLFQAVRDAEIVNRLQITEEEARQYYRAHPEEFMSAPMMTLREIFISVQTESRGGQEVFNAASDEAAQQKILSLRDRALKGEDFATLVTEASESGSKANGGLIGPVNLNELSEGLRDRLLKLKQGDIDEPIRTPKGYQLLKVEQKTEAAPRPFEEVRNDIGNRVMQERGQALLDAYLVNMRAQAIIEWKDDELKQMYEQYRASKKTN